MSAAYVVWSMSPDEQRINYRYRQYSPAVQRIHRTARALINTA